MLTTGTFVSVCGHDFVDWDDYGNVARNSSFQPPTLAHIAGFWRQSYFGMYIPVTYSLWGGVATLARSATPDEHGFVLNPYVFHAANLLLHVLAVLLVYAILQRIGAASWPAFFGAALFAVHPVQVEPVAWISGTKDVLAGVLSLCAILLHLHYLRALARGDPRRRAALLFAAATVVLVLAMLAKPSSMATPLIVFVIDVLLLRRSLKRAEVECLFCLLLIAPLLVMGRSVQPSGTWFAASLWARPFVAADALAFYLLQLLAPVHLCPDYGRSPRWLLRSNWMYVTWALPAAVAALCWWSRRRFPWIVAACAIVVACLLPVLGLLHFEFQIYSTVGDRYLYLAMLGPALLVSYLLQRYRSRVAFTIAVALATALAVRSFLQVRYWRDSKTLFGHTAEVNPDSVAAHNVLASIGLEEHRPVQEAIDHYEAALRTEPEHGMTLVHLGNVLAGSDPHAAIRYYERAERIMRLEPVMQNNLGSLLVQVGRIDEAAKHIETAIRLDPSYAAAYSNLGVVYGERGDFSRAGESFRTALRFNPNDPGAIVGLAALQKAQATTRPR